MYKHNVVEVASAADFPLFLSIGRNIVGLVELVGTHKMGMGTALNTAPV